MVRKSGRRFELELMFGLDESRKRAKKLSDCIIGIPDVITRGAFAKTTRKEAIAESVTRFIAKAA